MSAQLSLAILGAGLFAKEAHVPALATLGDSVVVKAVYSRSEKSAKELADEINSLLGSASASPSIYHDADPKNSLDTLLARSDIEAVLIVLPINTQPEIVIKSLAAGKHVLSEKPVSADVASGIELIKTYLSDYKPKGLIWRIAENFESGTCFRAAGQAIRDGKIGKVSYFTANMELQMSKDNKYYKTPWRTVPDYQGGFLLDGGVHQAAALRVILPEPMKYISAFASLNIDWLAPLDTITSIIKTTKGITGTLTISFGLPTPTSNSTCKIIGSSGQLILAHAGDKFTTSIINSKGEAESSEHKIDGVPLELASFVKVVKGGADDGLGEPINALKDVALLQAAFDSRGQLIDLEELMKL